MKSLSLLFQIDRKHNNTTLWVSKKQGVAEPFGMSLSNFLELSRNSYLI